MVSVVDGDTLRLADGSLLRMIGINAPELAYQDKPAQVMAVQARDFLMDIVSPPEQVRLVYGVRKQDRHGRDLAHVLLNSGMNVQERMLQEGMAFQISLPPNLLFQDCYIKAQGQAIKHKRGVWSKQEYRSQGVEQFFASGARPGYQRIKGSVQNLVTTEKSLWLNLSSRFAIRIRREDLAYFVSSDLESLGGRAIEVNGWVRPMAGKMVMMLYHPTALSLAGLNSEERIELE